MEVWGGGLGSHGAGLREHITVDVQHQVPAGRVLHHEAHVLWCLETAKQVHQKGVSRAGHSRQDPLLTHQAGQDGGGAGVKDYSSSLPPTRPPPRVLNHQMFVKGLAWLCTLGQAA